MNTVGSARRKEAMHALNPFAPGAGRQPKELVGREQELEIMDRIIARTKAGYSDRGLVDVYKRQPMHVPRSIRGGRECRDSAAVRFRCHHS